MTERGPDWNSLEKIEIIFNRRSYDITVEASETL